MAKEPENTFAEFLELKNHRKEDLKAAFFTTWLLTEICARTSLLLSTKKNL